MPQLSASMCHPHMCYTHHGFKNMELIVHVTVVQTAQTDTKGAPNSGAKFIEFIVHTGTGKVTVYGQLVFTLRRVANSH